MGMPLTASSLGPADGVLAMANEEDGVGATTFDALHALCDDTLILMKQLQSKADQGTKQDREDFR